MRVLTADGEIELARRYFWARGPGGRFPADASVGIEAGRVSPGAREILCRLGMVQDFRQAADDAARIGNVPVGREKLRQLVESEAATITHARNGGELNAAWTSADALVPGGGRIGGRITDARLRGSGRRDGADGDAAGEG